MSSHPNPGNRYEAINQEAAQASVSNPVRNTPEFTQVTITAAAHGAGTDDRAGDAKAGGRRTGRDTAIRRVSSVA